jgi:HK97 family phage major capsid protein
MRTIPFSVDSDKIQRAATWIRGAVFNDPASILACKKGNGFALTRAADEFQNVVGGFVVPESLSGEILANFSKVGTFAASARLVTMPTEKVSVPRRGGGLTAVYASEGGQINEQVAGWDSIALTARKAVSLVRCSSELFEDSATSLVSWFTEEFGHTMADRVDTDGWTGTGISTNGGTVGVATKLATGHAGGVAAAVGHDLASELDTVDISNLMALLPEQNWPNAAFFCSGYTAATCFSRLGAATGGLTGLSYAGIPIVTTPKLPGAGSQTGKVMIAFGDLRAAAIVGIRSELIVDVSAHRLLDTDELLIRARSRFCVVVHDVGDVTTPGPVVGLIGA